MEPPEEPVSEVKPEVASSPRPRVAKGSPATAKTAPARASPKTRAKAAAAAPPAKKAPKKAAQRPQKPSETVGDAAEKEQELPLVDEAAPCSASQPLQPVTETPSPACPPEGDGEQLSQPQLPLMEPAQPASLPPASASTPLPPESPLEEPPAKRAKPAIPEPACPPATAGVAPTETPEMTPQMRRIISEAIAQGIAAGIQQHRPAASDNASQQGQAPPPPPMTVPETLKELPLSGDKGNPDPHGFIGLFNPALFKALLQKAKAAARIGGNPARSDPALSDPNNLLFSEPGSDKEEIPCPKFFLDVIQRQWVTPGAYHPVGGVDKQFYNVAPNLTSALEMPTVDGPVAALAPDSILCNDVNALKPEDKKTEVTLCKGYQSAAWAVKSAMAASFFNRTSLLWLKQMQARIPTTDLQTHEDINNLIAAAEYSADATLNSAKFASRAIGSSVTARRLLWLRYWQSDNKSKWKLASACFKGDKLFGEALEPFLKETKDKKKILPHTFKSSPYFQKPSFRGTNKANNFTQPQRAYFQQSDRQSDRSGYGDRSRQQFQSKRPFRGNRSQSYPSSSRSLQSQGSRGSEATGDCSPKGFEEMEHDSLPNMTQQTSGIQEIQNPVHTGEHPGGRHPEVNRSHRSTATRPYIADSPMMDNQRAPPLSVQSPPRDTSYALGSPQDYSYSRPTVSSRHVDRIRLSPPRNRGSSHNDPGPSGSFRESGIHSQPRQEPLASYRQDAPPSSIYREDMHSFPVPGPPAQHQRSGEPDPIGPTGASRPRLTIVKQDGVVRLHCSRGPSGYQQSAMVPPAYPEIQQEQFNYRRPSPIRSPPVPDVTDRNQGMHIQGNEPLRDRYGRQYARLESPDRDPGGRRPVDRRGMTNQRQPGRDPNRPRSPLRDLDERLQPPRSDPSRERSHQGPYDPPREHPLQMYPGRRRQRAEPS